MSQQHTDSLDEWSEQPPDVVGLNSGTWNRCETIDKAEVRRVAQQVLKDMPGVDTWFVVNAMVQGLGANE